MTKVRVAISAGFVFALRNQHVPLLRSVPKGRLNLAQDDSPGYIVRHDQVPEGRLKVVQDRIATYFQPSLRDRRPCKSYPGLSSDVPSGLTGVEKSAVLPSI
jgi:hypothetical protein